MPLSFFRLFAWGLFVDGMGFFLGSGFWVREEII